MTDKDIPRLILAVGILLLFGYAYVRNPADELLIGAVIALATTAVNYFLGSSKGSSDKSTQLAKQAAETQHVQIDQPANEPVPVEEMK